MNSASIPDQFVVKTEVDQALYLTDPSTWDDLVARAETNSIFLSSAWLASWAQTINATAQHSIITISVCQHGTLLGAVALVHDGKKLSFAASGYADYADFLIDRSVTDKTFDEILAALLEQTKQFSNSLDLTRIPSVSRTIERLPSSASWHVTQTAKTEAPIMDMQFVEDRLKKKSIVRHARKLAKMGELTCYTTADADETLNELDTFFEQHIARWKPTEFPSLFLDDQRRSFYRALTQNLAANKSLRFSTIKLDGQLIAAHFGFFFGGVYTWYKPSYDPDFARYSPGEVLLKHLLEQAITDQATHFDFTIGGEAFKFRFASETRHVFSYHATTSFAAATVRRLRRATSRVTNSRTT